MNLTVKKYTRILLLFIKNIERILSIKHIHSLFIEIVCIFLTGGISEELIELIFLHLK